MGLRLRVTLLILQSFVLISTYMLFSRRAQGAVLFASKDICSLVANPDCQGESFLVVHSRERFLSGYRGAAGVSRAKSYCRGAARGLHHIIARLSACCGAGCGGALCHKSINRIIIAYPEIRSHYYTLLCQHIESTHMIYTVIARQWNCYFASVVELP